MTTAFLYQSGKTRVIETSFNRRLACAAFHPFNDKKVYIFGGIISGGMTYSKKAAVFNYEDDSINEIKDLPIDLGQPGCIGFNKSDGKAVRMDHFLNLYIISN